MKAMLSPPLGTPALTPPSEEDTPAVIAPIASLQTGAEALAPEAGGPVVPTSPDTEALRPGSLPALVAASTFKLLAPEAVPGVEAVTLTLTAGLLLIPKHVLRFVVCPGLGNYVRRTRRQVIFLRY